MTSEGTYQPAKSHSKAARASAPIGAGLVLTWAARQFWSVEIPADVALAIVGGVAYGIEWARNRAKHGWKR